MTAVRELEQQKKMSEDAIVEQIDDLLMTANDSSTRFAMASGATLICESVSEFQRACFR